MNVILEQVNSAGLWFVEFALPMLVQSSVLILILLLTDFALRKKVRAVFRYGIWLLVLIKLVLPTSLSAPLSLGYFLGEGLAYVDRTETTTETAQTAPAIVTPMIDPPRIEAGSDTSAIAPTTPTIEPVVAKPVNTQVVSATPLSWQGAVFLAWLTVVITMGLLLLQRAIFVRGLVAQAKEANSMMDDTLESCRERMGVKRKLGLKVSANAASPAVCGLFRPVILVPQNLTSSLSKSQLRAVLLHELAHIRRGDLWVNLAQTVLQIIYFYNPLLWAANLMIRRVREQAVDEMVLVAMGEAARQYPQTLVNVAKMAFKRPALSLRLIGVVESKSALAGRIKHILNRPMPKRAKLGILGLAVVIVTAAILLPMATCTPGPPSLVIKGTVKDAQTGKPIAGARVFDDGYGPKPNWEQIKADVRSEWGAITNSAGEYSFLTWPEHHSIKIEAPGYKAERRSLYSGHFVFNKKDEEIFDFALEPDGIVGLSEFKKTLSNGVTVELVGICEHPSQGKQWWRPDGTGFIKPLYDKFKAKVYPDSNEQAKEIAVRLWGPQELVNQTSVEWKIADSTSSAGNVDDRDERGDQIMHTRAVAFKCDVEQQSLDFKVGIAAGPWQVVSTCPVDTWMHHEDDSGIGQVIWHGPSEKDGMAFIVAAIAKQTDDIRLIAVDEQGNIHHRGRSSGYYRDNRQNLQAKFDLPLAQVKEFQLQTRPYDWVTFKNVSLRPGVITDMQIEVEKSDVLRVPSDKYPTIQSAVNAAKDGDTMIVVKPDVYEQNKVQIILQANVFTVNTPLSSITNFLKNEFDINKTTMELTDAQAEQFKEWVTSIPGTNIATSPRTIVFDGQSTEMSITTRTEYILYEKDADSPSGYKPKREEIKTGVEIEFRPELRQDNKLINLALNITKSDIPQIKEITHESGNEVQLPAISRREISTMVAIPIGKYCLISIAGIRNMLQSEIDIQPDTTGKQTILLIKADVQVEGAGGKTAKSYRKRYFATLVVTDDGVVFKGQKLTWEQVQEKLKTVPDRQITALEVAFDPAIVPDNLRGSAMLKWVSQSAGFQKAAQLRQELGFEYLSNVGVDRVSSRRGPVSVRFEDALRFGEQIPVALMSFEEQPLLRTTSIEFEKAGADIRAVLKAAVTSYPRKRWEIGVRLLDGQGRQFTSVVETFENSGLAVRYPVHTQEEMNFSFGQAADLANAKRFEVKLRQFTNKLAAGKSDVQVEVEKPQSLIFHGLDLTAVPHTTNSSRLPDLFEERPPGSKSYHIQKDVTAIYSGLDGTVYFIPRRNIFYVQHDKLGSSTLTYYGPFEGNPVQVLNLQPDVQVETEGVVGLLNGAMSQTKRYDVEGFELEAGFIPDKPEIILGEPLFITFSVTNRADKPYKFTTGGAQRGCVRDNNFHITVSDANGQMVKDPYSYKDFGGRIGIKILEKGCSYTKRLFLGHWCSFEKPGRYIVTCKRTLTNSLDRGKQTKVPIDISFTLRVAPFAKDKMRGIIAGLGKKLRSGDEQSLIEATLALCEIDDEDVVPLLAWSLTRGNWQNKNPAIDGLSRFSNGNALIIAALKDSDSAVRVHATDVLGKIKSKEAVHNLVAALKDKKYSVRQITARALGDIGDKTAVGPLKQCVYDENMNVRLAVIKALQKLGEPFQEKLVVPVILSKKGNAFQSAIWFVRRNAGDKAVPILIRCLDMDDPSVSSYYNYTLLWQISACGGPNLKYHHDFDGKGTEQQVEENKKTLKVLKDRLKDYAPKVVTDKGKANVQVEIEEP